MGTFSKPGLTRGEERLVDKSGIAINQAIQKLGTSFESQVAMINLNKNAALEQQMQVYKQASEIESSDASLGNNLAQALRLQADDLYKTTINTMGEDQTEALRKESNLIGSVENLGGNLEVINITAKKLQQMRQEGKSGLVSINSNPKASEFYNNIALYGGAGSDANGVKAVKSRIENGNIILSQENSNGEVFEFSMQGNANAMANGGAPHISFVDSEAINGSYKTNWTGLTKDIPALVKQTQEYNKSRGITTNVDKIYEQQSSIAFEKMKNNKAEIALNNSDDFQFLTFTGNYKADPKVDTIDKDGNVLFTGSQEQRERIQLAKAEYAQQQFSNQNVRTKITENLPKPITKTKTTSRGGSSQSQDTFKPDVDGIIEGIKGLKADPEKGQTYFIGKKIKGREIIDVKVDGNDVVFMTRNITQAGKIVDKPEEYNLNNVNSINNLEDDLIKTIIGTNKDSQKARVYAHDLTKSLITGEEDFSLNEKSVDISLDEWKDSEENLVGGEDEDDDDYQKGVLYKIYPNFKFEQAGFGTNKIVAISPNGKNKTKPLSTGNPNDYETLKKFIEENSKEPKEIKTQAEFDKAYANLAPGESITAKGKTYTKPSKK